MICKSVAVSSELLMWNKGFYGAIEVDKRATL